MDLTNETVGILTATLVGAYIICCVELARNLDGFESSERTETSYYRKTELEEIFGL